MKWFIAVWLLKAFDVFAGIEEDNDWSVCIGVCDQGTQYRLVKGVDGDMELLSRSCPLRPCEVNLDRVGTDKVCPSGYQPEGETCRWTD